MTISSLPGNALADQKIDTTFLNDATAVPAGAVFLGGAALTQAGSAYVCGYPAGGAAPQGVSSIKGAALRADGARTILAGGTPVQFISGLPYTAKGELCVSTNLPTQFQDGIGKDAAGLVCVEAVT